MISSVGAKTSLVAAVSESQKQIKSEQVRSVEKDNDRVTQIAAAIKNGTYKLNLQSTSEKMALNLLNS